MGEIQMDGQDDFSGGVTMLRRPGDADCNYLENVEVRNGYAETRRSVRNAYGGSVLAATEGITFQSITFPFQFRANVWANPSGGAFIRLPTWDDWRAIFSVGSNVFIVRGGLSESVSVPSGQLSHGMEINFVQAGNAVVMFRKGLKPLIWKGGPEGFAEMTPPNGRSIPAMDNGIYFGGRIVGWREDTIFISDIFDPESYDLVNAQFSAQGGQYSVSPGAGNNIMCIRPFSENHLAIFKKYSIYLASGIITSSSSLENFSIKQKSNEIGTVGPNAVAEYTGGIAFWSHRGMERMYTNQYGQIVITSEPASEPIKPIVARITKHAEEGICGATYDGYTIFAVPVDGADHNNVLIPVDNTTGKTGGTWVGIWKSKPANILSVRRFYSVDGSLFMLCNDGYIRTFVGFSMSDSDTPDVDCPEHSAAGSYIPGDIVYVSRGSASVYFSAKKHIPTYDDQGTIVYPDLENSEYWAPVSRDEAFAIISIIETRLYDHGTGITHKRYQTATILFDAIMPNISLAIIEPGTGPEHVIYEGIQYNPDAYKTVRTEYDNTNRRGDFNAPMRNDYPVVLRVDSPVYIGSDGVKLDVFTSHTMRFLPVLASCTGFMARITNRRGRLRVRSVVVPAEQQQLSWRKV